ncbi:MAG: cell envelope integrity protein CreD [Leptospiraceae bacterium]|nr:cell envelope integrity protein CreD [Leptospiraceae bacterium]
MLKINVNRMSLKIVLLGALTLVLLIPAFMVKGVINERKERRNEAVEEINSHWGGPIEIVGPILLVPLQSHSKKETKTRWLTIVPSDLSIESDLKAEKRARGIFNSVVYHTEIKLEGGFVQPAPAAVSGYQADWNGARLAIGVTDLQGITTADLQWNGRRHELQPGTPGPWDVRGLHADVGSIQGGRFQISMQLRGSSLLRFGMIGQKTRASMQGNWTDPSFDGAFLPANRQVSAKGFKADWNIATMLNRDFPAQWISGPEMNQNYLRMLSESASGLSLIVPVDLYQKSERSVKYAGMFIVLVFLAYFLFEVLFGYHIHPIQYLFLGGAKILFYLLLLSMAEHIGFGWSYLIAAIASTAQISLFSMGILKSKIRASWMTGILLGIYAYLYSLLQLQDYALIIGSVGLFAILGLVMYLTRDYNWYKESSN